MTRKPPAPTPSEVRRNLIDRAVVLEDKAIASAERYERQDRWPHEANAVGTLILARIEAARVLRERAERLYVPT